MPALLAMEGNLTIIECSIEVNLQVIRQTKINKDRIILIGAAIEADMVVVDTVVDTIEVGIIGEVVKEIMLVKRVPFLPKVKLLHSCQLEDSR
jgi:hypothetical protein